MSSLRASAIIGAAFTARAEAQAYRRMPLTRQAYTAVFWNPVPRERLLNVARRFIAGKRQVKRRGRVVTLDRLGEIQ